MTCRRCGCDEFKHIRYGGEKVCDICGPHGCQGFKPLTQLCGGCGEPDSTHRTQSDCLNALRERVEALEATHGEEAE